MKLTVGLRYGDHTKRTQDTNPFLDANFINGPGSQLSREAGIAGGSDTYNVDRAALYGAGDAFAAAVGTPR